MKSRIVIFALLLAWTSCALAGSTEDLFEAARNGQTERAKASLAHGADVNAATGDSYAMTSLMLASRRGNLELVQALLASGARVNAQDRAGATSLMHAARYGRLEVVRALLLNGAEVNTQENSQDGSARTALMFASEFGHVDIVQALLAAGAEVNAKDDSGQTALMFASAEGYLGDVSMEGANFHRSSEDYFRLIRLLLDDGADVNVADKNGVTALMRAAGNGEADVATELLARGADVNAKNKDGNTALMQCWASTYHYNAYPAVLQVLIARGATVNVNDKHVIDALLFAAAKGNFDVVSQLLAQGIDVNVKGQANIRGEMTSTSGSKRRARVAGMDAKANLERDVTPLILSSLSGHLDVVDALLAKNANVSATDAYGRTALMLAAENGFMDVVQALLAGKADVNAKANDHATALMMASRNAHLDMIEILHANHAELDAQDAKGFTTLMQAAERGQLDVVRLILDQGADANLKAYDGTTALMLAGTSGHVDVMQALLSRNADVNARDDQGASAIELISKGNIEARNLLIKAGAVTAMKSPDWNGVWKGRLGEHEITACFELDEGDLFQLGVYYDASDRQPIRLEQDKEAMQAYSSLMLHEAKGAWNLTMSNNDTLQGTWSYPGKQNSINLARVPAANQGEAPQFCSSAEFNSGRKIKPEFIFSIRTVNGVPYRFVADKNNEGIAGFELIGTDKITESMNQQFRKDFLSRMDDAFECTSGVLGRFGEQGEFSSTTGPIFITKRWLSLAVSTDASCGGAHPNSDTKYQLWDRDTGKLENIWTWFNEKGARQENGSFVQGPALAEVLASFWPKNADQDADHACDDAERMASWNMHPGPDGLIFSAELPHVIQACAEDVLVPYKNLFPMLNAHGKAAAKSISADLAKQHAARK